MGRFTVETFQNVKSSQNFPRNPLIQTGKENSHLQFLQPGIFLTTLTDIRNFLLIFESNYGLRVAMSCLPISFFNLNSPPFYSLLLSEFLVE